MFEGAMKAGLVYELVALNSPLPTITAMVRSARSKPLPLYVASLVGVVSMLGALAWHLILDDWENP